MSTEINNKQYSLLMSKKTNEQNIFSSSHITEATKLKINEFVLV